MSGTRKAFNVIGGLLLAIIMIWAFWNAPEKAAAKSTITDLVEQYQIMKVTPGMTKEELAMQASAISEACLAFKDQDGYRKWREVAATCTPGAD